MKARIKGKGKQICLYSPYLEVSFDIVRPMPCFMLWCWRLLGFKCIEE